MDVTMPETGSPEGAAVTAWLRLPGDPVEAGEGLCLVAWDGNVAELESPEGGVLRMLAVEVGRTVPAGTTLARIESPPPVPAPPVPEPRPEPVMAPSEPEPEEESVSEPLPGPEPGPEPMPDPEPALDPQPVTAKVVPEGLLRDAPVLPAPPQQLNAFLSPAVRRFVVDHELDPGTIEGSGRGGRVTLADARAAVERATSD
jgi:pyruvate dehydrogenase E2 component (dihydrolipoamide acetyltransferase)